MRSFYFASALALSAYPFVACSSDDGDKSESTGGSGGSTSGGASSSGGTQTSATGASANDGGEGGEGSALPGFDLERTVVSAADVPSRGATCSGATNPSAQIGKVWLAQTHVLEPTADNFTQNDDAQALLAEAQLPKFRLVSHRPALLEVDVTGSGAAPEVSVVASRNGAELGVLCLAGPITLPGAGRARRASTTASP